jgi:hypothetical protein
LLFPPLFGELQSLDFACDPVDLLSDVLFANVPCLIQTGFFSLGKGFVFCLSQFFEGKKPAAGAAGFPPAPECPARRSC